MVNEYYQAFLNTLPDETREDVAAILGVGNLTIEKRLEYLEEYLKEKELKTCKKLMQIEVCASVYSYFQNYPYAVRIFFPYAESRSP